ncbi:MAG: hypothetical protein WC700_10460 [Gemmatimonadaceae bacterium]|jgi:hypothetical protein
MGVEALHKAMHVRCEHATDAGCARYATRPEECRAYHCAWRYGHGADDERPDGIGMVLWFPRPGAAPGWERIIIAAELEAGAADRPDNWYRLLTWRQRGVQPVLHRRAEA